ncbi:GGDEF domain-containing protein [Paludibacterium purpuratum]|uniref:Diguanylate cyclase (GGDEF)-like protein n=1 Tax=Paludibacterium purpuratum TaxID=1144873 RepID=A0A4R7B7C5_9NEIS|nr:GGDEF domain-containing protein [Paludibacterium purpuratum]TDR80383.1 diguanylate cyclase (GGDEF)-like protein [Paludibacterium purpuratum]
MRMRLVYLTCTLLWLVMSVLIGLSFISRSVFLAEQDFHAFEQRLVERIGQTLEANEVVLYSYAAFQSIARTDVEKQAFAARLIAHNPQIKRLFSFDDSNAAPRDGFLSTLSDADRRQLMTLRQAVVARHGAPVMKMDDRPNSEPSFYLVRAIDPSMRHFVAMQVMAAALLPDLTKLPAGGYLRLWQGEQGNRWLLARQTASRSALENLLFPQFNSLHQLGGVAQPLTLQLSWQLGFTEVRRLDCVAAGVISLGLLIAMLLGLTRYARFLEGSQEREMRLFYLANHDRLTNLANRNLFYDRLQHAISRLNRKGRNLAVLFLDMDRFKPVNDTYGHATGDRVLQVIAARLKAELRTEDTVARLGGDEFAVLIEEVESKQEIILVVERLKRAIERAYELDGHTIRLGVSIGVAYYPEDGVLIEELLSVADRKMYGEKNEPVLAV